MIHFESHAKMNTRAREVLSIENEPHSSCCDDYLKSNIK